MQVIKMETDVAHDERGNRKIDKNHNEIVLEEQKKVDEQDVGMRKKKAG